MLCPRCGDDGAVKNGSGRTYHAACGKYGVYRPEGAEPNAAAEARKGFAPEHGLSTPYPDGYYMGKTTIQRNGKGEIVNTWERMIADHERQLEIIRESLLSLCEELPQLPPPKLPRMRGKYISNMAACYPIGDAHIGMLAWNEEAGEDWDLSIAERIQCAAMDALVQGAPKTERGIIVNLGDWLHYDSMEPKTSRSGHVLDADGRYAKMIRIGLKVMRQCIESALTKHKTVHVVNVKGNHDDVGALWMALSLSHIYANDPRVTVDTTPSVFNYFRVGKTLVGMHHGNTCKPQALAGVMAADRAQDWGECNYRYWLVGHVHHQGVHEFPGVTVETFGTLAAKDAYAAAGGWRARRDMKCIVYHEDHGEVARYTVNPTMFQDVPCE